MKVSPLLHFASVVTMKAFLTLVLLAALGLMVTFVSCSYTKIAEAVILYPSFSFPVLVHMTVCLNNL
jgi:hypothetical protein